MDHGIPHTYRTRNFILPYSEPCDSIPFFHMSLESILILFFTYSLNSQNGPVPSDLPTQTLYELILSSLSATYPTHLILLV